MVTENFKMLLANHQSPKFLPTGADVRNRYSDSFPFFLRRDNSSLKTCYPMLLFRVLFYSSKYFNRASEWSTFLQLLWMLGALVVVMGR